MRPNGVKVKPFVPLFSNISPLKRRCKSTTYNATGVAKKQQLF